MPICLWFNAYIFDILCISISFESGVGLFAQVEVVFFHRFITSFVLLTPSITKYSSRQLLSLFPYSLRFIIDTSAQITGTYEAIIFTSFNAILLHYRRFNLFIGVVKILCLLVEGVIIRLFFCFIYVFIPCFLLELLVAASSFQTNSFCVFVAFGNQIKSPVFRTIIMNICYSGLWVGFGKLHVSYN